MGRQPITLGSRQTRGEANGVQHHENGRSRHGRNNGDGELEDRQRETNDFYFKYHDETLQILKVSRDKTIVKSRTIPIPGIGIFGPFAGIGALGPLGNIGSLMKMTSLTGKGGIGAIGGGLTAPAGLRGMGSLGALGGMGGAANSAILSRLAGSGRMSGLKGFSSLNTSRPLAPSQKYSVLSDPDGGSSAGFLTLWN